MTQRRYSQFQFTDLTTRSEKLKQRMEQILKLPLLQKLTSADYSNLRKKIQFFFKGEFRCDLLRRSFVRDLPVCHVISYNRKELHKAPDNKIDFVLKRSADVFHRLLIKYIAGVQLEKKSHVFMINIDFDFYSIFL